MMTVGGVGAISYFDAANTALKVAFCGNAACTTATIDTVDATNDTGHFSSIVSFTNSLILISYYDNTLKDLKLAQCNSTISCNAATILTVTSAGDVGQWSAMPATPSSQPLMTRPAPMMKPNGTWRSRELSNLAPF